MKRGYFERYGSLGSNLSSYIRTAMAARRKPTEAPIQMPIIKVINGYSFHRIAHRCSFSLLPYLLYRTIGKKLYGLRLAVDHLIPALRQKNLLIYHLNCSRYNPGMAINRIFMYFDDRDETQKMLALRRPYFPRSGKSSSHLYINAFSGNLLCLRF